MLEFSGFLIAIFQHKVCTEEGKIPKMFAISDLPFC
jgi:hypothetical protein